MASTIQIKRGTGSAVPSGLADGELAINLDNGKLYFGSGSTSVNSFRFTNLTAENYIVSSSVTNITTKTLSGSTQFGDSADDIHNMTGSLRVSGSSTGEHYIIGNNVGIGTDNPAFDLHIGDNSNSIFGANLGSDGLLIAPVANNVRVIIEGDADASITLVDDGASSNEQAMMLQTDGGFTKFRSLNDDTSGHSDNIIVMNHDNGKVGIGSSSPSAILEISGSNDVNELIRLVGDSSTMTFVNDGGATRAFFQLNGTGLDIEYLIGRDAQMNIESADTATGWGVGTWGESTWGTARDVASDTVALEATQWSLELWGDDLLANNRNGQIYYWDTSAGETNRAVLVSSLAGATDVPTKNRTIAISFPDRHLIVGGTTLVGTTDQDPMLIRFSDQEDFTKFTPTATNTAGDQRLEVGNKIVSIIPTKDETFINTDEAVYGMTFVGPPFTFSFRLLAVNCGAVAKNGAISVDGNVYWIGKSNFFVYNGSVQELPCTVQYFVFNRIQQRYADKTFVGQNKKFNEITWFYVSEDNTAGTVNPEPDSYVTYNYAENVWTIGTLDRNVWLDARGFRDVPFAFDGNAKLYDHETGTSNNGEAMNCFVESSELEIDQTGNKTFLIDRIVPDVTMTDDTNLFLEFKCRKFPNATEITKGPFTITNSTDKVSTRAKGRQIAVKYSSNGTNDDWSLGDFRINAKEDSFR